MIKKYISAFLLLITLLTIIPLYGRRRGSRHMGSRRYSGQRGSRGWRQGRRYYDGYGGWYGPGVGIGFGLGSGYYGYGPGFGIGFGFGF